MLALVADLSPLAQHGAHLSIMALSANAHDPLNAYLTSAAAGRLEFARAFTDFGAAVQSPVVLSDPDLLEALTEGLIASLKDFRDCWQALSPLPETAALHAQQLDVIVKTIRVERLLLQAVRNRDASATLAAQALNAEGAELNALWSDLTIDALSR